MGLVLFVGACAGTQVVPVRPYPAVSASQLYARFQAERAAAFLMPLVSIARVDIPRIPSFDARLVVRRPGQLRLDVPYKNIAYDASQLVSDGRTMWVLDELNKQYFQGAASACVLGRTFGPLLQGMQFPFSADDLAEIFLGGAPLLEGATLASDQARWVATNRGREEIEIQNSQFIQRMQFFPIARGPLQLAGVERWDRKTGKLLWRVRNDRFVAVFQGSDRQAFLPRETHLQDGTTGKEMTLRWGTWDTNVAAIQREVAADGDTLFSLVATPDSPFQPVTCEGR